MPPRSLLLEPLLERCEAVRRRTDTLQTCRPAQARADLVARERSRIRLRRMPRISNAALWSAWIAARTSRPVFQRPQRSASATAAGPVAGPFVMGFRCQSVSEPQGVVQQLLTGSTEYGRETQRCRPWRTASQQRGPVGYAVARTRSTGAGPSLGPGPSFWKAAILTALRRTVRLLSPSFAWRPPDLETRRRGRC